MFCVNAIHYALMLVQQINPINTRMSAKNAQKTKIYSNTQGKYHHH